MGTMFNEEHGAAGKLKNYRLRDADAAWFTKDEHK